MNVLFRARDGKVFRRFVRGLYSPVEVSADEARDAQPLAPRAVMVRIGPRSDLYVRTHECVLHVGCPHCGAVAGSACRGASGDATAGTHVLRRNAFYRRG